MYEFDCLAIFIISIRVEALGFTYRMAFRGDTYPGSIHNAAFIPMIEGQATDEQKGWWLEKAYNHEIIGTYAQTEMGHGEAFTS